MCTKRVSSGWPDGGKNVLVFLFLSRRESAGLWPGPGAAAECLSNAIRIIKFDHWLEPGKDRDIFTYHEYVFLSLL